MRSPGRRRLRWPGASRDPARKRIARAMIGLAGSRGYEATTLEAVCGRADVKRAEFERCFAGKEECFFDVYDEVAAEFCERVLRAYEGPSSWHDRVWAAIWAAIGFLQEDPVRARFFAVEVNGAGARAQARRDRIMQVFADLVDAGREQLEDPSSISRCSAEIVGGAIYLTIQSKILDGCVDRGEDFLVELVYIAMLPYLGADAGRGRAAGQAAAVGGCGSARFGIWSLGGTGAG